MATNQHIRERLRASLSQLIAAHSGGQPLSSATKGTEREFFVEIFLKNVLPPAYRFGTGDITDVSGFRTGQVDVVIEHLSVPSFPLVGASNPRLYLADGVGAVLEVKSDLTRQWKQVLKTGAEVARLTRDSSGPVPFFVVGYRGWNSLDDLWLRVDEARAKGILVRGAISLDPPFYAGFSLQQFQQPLAPAPFPGAPLMPQMPVTQDVRVSADSEMGLMALLAELHARVSSLLFSQDVLLRYINIIPTP